MSVKHAWNVSASEKLIDERHIWNVTSSHQVAASAPFTFGIQNYEKSYIGL